MKSTDMHTSIIFRYLYIIKFFSRMTAKRGRGGARRDYTPVGWRNYWDQCNDVTVADGDVFKVYQKGSTGPLLILLHGGGYSALTWSLFAVSILYY